MTRNTFLVEYKLGTSLIKKVFTSFEEMFRFVQTPGYEHKIFRFNPDFSTFDEFNL